MANGNNFIADQEAEKQSTGEKKQKTKCTQFAVATGDCTLYVNVFCATAYSVHNPRMIYSIKTYWKSEASRAFGVPVCRIVCITFPIRNPKKNQIIC